ncbi:hypothetical protein [Mucilaginibacter dorajii]|uniref:Uncharacterized protein n=1 Tax=Mucilaginibacter dorajii TaxID=692994 RepID=A0ABP7PQL4_9SPHI|nr:hypothetical protein [Mucilaginibacter dorajii]MCS3736388.1 hypothetical protein [Mucilaginibacter dorajii]
MKIKMLLFFIVIFKVQLLFAQEVKDTTQKVTVKVGLKVDLIKQRHDKINAYADSINSYISGKLPDFLFDECFDWQKSFWPDLHSAVSVRWEILEKVHNQRALKAILNTRNKKLKRICDHKSDKVYPYLSVPMIEKSFYQLIQRRYKQI